MKLHPPPKGLHITLSLLLGLAAGRWLPELSSALHSSSARPPAKNAEHTTHTDKSSAARPASPTEVQRSRQDKLRTLIQSAPATALAQLLKEPDFKNRQQLIEEAFRALVLKDLPTAIQWLREHPSLRAVDLQFAMLELGQTDGARSLELLMRDRDLFSEDDLAYLAEGWAETDAKAALAVALTLPEGADQRAFLNEVFKVWSRTDMTAFLRWVKSAPESVSSILGSTRLDYTSLSPEHLPLLAAAGLWPQSTYEIREVLLRLCKEPGATSSLRRSIEQMPASRERDVILEAYAYALIDHGATAQALTLAAENGSHASRTSITSYHAATLAARGEISQALDYAAALEHPRASELARKSAFTTWSKKHPERIARFLQQNPGLPLDDKKTLILSWAEKSPLAAANWAANLEDRNAGARLIAEMAYTWSGSHPADALAWVSSQAAGPTRDEWLSRMIQARLNMKTPDTEGTQAFIRQVSSPAQRQTLAIMTATALLKTSAAKAQAWIQSPEVRTLLGEEGLSQAWENIHAAQTHPNNSGRRTSLPSASGNIPVFR